MSKVREVATNILINIEERKSYIHIELSNTLRKIKLSKKDEALLVELVQGTIQRKITLDYFLEPFLKKKVTLWVRILLQLSLYQMYFLERIPVHAIVHDAVEIAKKRGHRGIASLVNGVLRNVDRQGFRSFEEILDQKRRLAIETSHPEWLVNMWIEQYGFSCTEVMCKKNNTPPKQTVRINSYRTSASEVLSMLEEEEFPTNLHAVISNCLVTKRGNIAKTKLYSEGLITIQDASSQLVGIAVDPNPGEVILDACAAPGGKTTHVLELLKGMGDVVAFDLYDHRVNMIKENIKRLQLPNAKVHCEDIYKVRQIFNKESFDKIILDAPCSGLGVLRRKPDAKYTKTMVDISSLIEIQKEMLRQVAPLLKVGGRLIYSTCTVNKLENDSVLASFLKEHNESFCFDGELEQRLPEPLKRFVSHGTIQIFPQTMNSDGFFIAVLVKK